MLNESCKHEWQKNRAGKYRCLKCGEWEFPNNVYQRESLRHKFGFEKWMSILAFIVAVVALVISLFK